MNLCDTCEYCVIRKFYTVRPEDYTVVKEGDEGEPMIIQYCMWLDLVVSGEYTEECNKYKPITEGDDTGVQMSMWQRNLFDIYKRKR